MVRAGRGRKSGIRSVVTERCLSNLFMEKCGQIAL